MGSTTIGDVLDRVALLEEHLLACYGAIRDRCPDQGAKLLSYYLGRHRRQIDWACKDVEPGVLDRIRSLELPDDPVAGAVPAPPLLNTQPETITGEQLLAEVVTCHASLRALFLNLLDQDLTPEAVALLASLRDRHQREVSILRNMQAIHYF